MSVKEIKNNGNRSSWVIISAFVIICISYGLGVFLGEMEGRNAFKKEETQVGVEHPRISVDEMLKKLQNDKERNDFRGYLHAVKTMRPELDCTVAEKIVNIVMKVSKEKELDPSLVFAIIAVESRFNPFAESDKEAIGLMQIRYKVWKEDPILINNGAVAQGAMFWLDINIESGTDILRKYLDEANGDIAKCLWRYNSGQTDLPKKEYEIKYVNKVLLYMYKINQMKKVYMLEPDVSCYSPKFQIDGGVNIE